MSKLVCPKTSEFKKRAQSLLVVVSSEPTEIYEEFTDRVRKYNNMPPFNFSDVFANFNKVRSNKSNRLPVIYGTLLIATIGHQSMMTVLNETLYTLNWYLLIKGTTKII